MVGHSVTRVWTVASWHLADARHVTETVADALEGLDCDLVALQWVRSRPVRHIANRLDLPYAWVPSHHPVSRLVPGSAIGLAVLTPHRFTHSSVVPVGDEESLWSSDRRAAHTVTVARHDQSAYSLWHSTGTVDQRSIVANGGPPMLVVGEPSGPGLRSTISLPDEATVVSTEHQAPIDGAHPLVVTAFEMTWVEGGFATG